MLSINDCHNCCSFYFARTLIKGDKQAGFSIFWADDGLDTGPILLQRTTDVDPEDTVDTIYNRFLYPEGITAMVCQTCFCLPVNRGTKQNYLNLNVGTWLIA